MMSMSSMNARKRSKQFLQESYDKLCNNVAELRAQLEAKEAELREARRNAMTNINAAIKGLCYAFGTTLAIFICLSNSLTAVAQTLWSDCGNNWEYLWGYLESNFSAGVLAIGGTVMLHMTLYWGYSSILLWIQFYKPHWISRYKIQPGVNEELNREQVWHGVKVVLCNQFFVSLPLTIAMFPIFKWRGCSFTLPLPAFNWFVAEIAMMALIEEVCFYYTHRLMHTKAFYGRFHKQHHEWTSPIACMAMYTHPVEYFGSFVLPMYLGPLITGCHLATTWVWLAVGTLNTLNAHCGFHFPFMPSPEAHDFHHLRFNEMFGVLGILDYLHGTDREFRKSSNYGQHSTFFSFTYQSGNPTKVAKQLSDSAADRQAFAAAKPGSEEKKSF